MNLADPDQRREYLRRRQVSAKNRARKTKKEFTLRPGFASILYDQQAGRCAVSGKEFNLQSFPDLFVKQPFAPSIDRKLSNGGYTEENVRLVCVAVNFGMGQWGEEVYMDLARGAIEREKKDRKNPDPAGDADWYARQRERIAAAEALCDRRRGQERKRLRCHIASLKRALTMGPERLRAAAQKAKNSKRIATQGKPTRI